MKGCTDFVTTSFFTILFLIPVHLVRSNFFKPTSLSESMESKIAAMNAKQKLSDISAKWAALAEKIASWKAKEVMDITSKAQEAQVLSLKLSSISTRLKNAVQSSQTVFEHALERYKTLSQLANDAETHSVATSIVLDLFRYIEKVRETWAKEESDRAMRLSKQLQHILYELREATKSSKDAHEYAMMATQFKYYQKR